MMQKYQTLSLNNLPHLIITNLWVKKIDNKIKEKMLVNESNIYGFIDNSDLNKKTEKLATKA